MFNKEISSAKIIFILSVYFSSILNLAFWRYVGLNFQIVDFRTALFAVSLVFFIFIPLYLLFNLIFTPNFGRKFVIFLLICSSVANYYMFAFNVYIDSDMVRNIAETNFAEASEHISLSFWLTVLITGILPAVILAKIKVKPYKTDEEVKARAKNMLLAFLILLVFAAACFKEYAVIGRNHNKITKIINTFNYPYSVIRFYQKKAKANRQFRILDASPSLQKNADNNLIVLIVGETARAQNFSLNGYERETNPLLKKQDVVSFQDVRSCGTLTAVSLPCMFAAAGRDDFDTDDAAYMQNLLDIAQKAGYKVKWFENDSGCKGVCNRIDTVNLFSSAQKPWCADGTCHDEILLKPLQKEIQQASGNTLLILHTIGSHGPAYFKRYPDKFEKFTPACKTSDIQTCRKQDIVNTYDNTILYTDFIVASAIDLLKQQTPKNMAASLIYISDHGESLGEAGTYLHGLPYAIAPDFQTQVPMIVWLSDAKKQKTNWSCLKKAAHQQSFSHDNFFHSVLGLAQIKSSLYLPQDDIFAGCAVSKD